MKNIGIAIICFITAINLTNAQSEEETIDFLNAKLSAYGAPMGNEPVSFKVSMTIDSRSNKKIIQIDMIINQRLFQTSKFHPEHISTVESYRPENGNLCLKVVSSKGMILKKYKSEDVERFYGDIRLPLLTSDEEVIRVKKALLHLLELNNAPLIDDNLFKN